MNVEKIVGEYIDRSLLNSSNDILEATKREDGHQFYKVSVSNWYAFGKFDQPLSRRFKLA